MEEFLHGGISLWRTSSLEESSFEEILQGGIPPWMISLISVISMSSLRFHKKDAFLFFDEKI